MESQSNFGLQAADYCSWALYQQRKNGVDTYVENFLSSIVRIDELDFAQGEGADGKEEEEKK